MFTVIIMGVTGVPPRIKSCAIRSFGTLLFPSEGKYWCHRRREHVQPDSGACWGIQTQDKGTVGQVPLVTYYVLEEKLRYSTPLCIKRGVWEL